MANPIIRSIGAVLLSIVVAVALFMAVEGVSSILHPWPADFAGTFEEVARQVETYPTWVLIFLGVVGWGAIMVICTFIATRIGHNRNPWHGYGVGLFLLAMAGFNLSMLPYPNWYRILLLIVLPVAGYLGIILAKEKALATE